jgi:hypothetical protein
MRADRRQQVTRGLVVLAVVLGSLWAGALGASGPGSPADRLTAGRPLPGVEAAAPPDRAPALRSSAERPDPRGRLLPLLLGGLLAGSPAVAYGMPARRRRSGLRPARSPVLSARRGPRAPPHLQPA